MTTYLSDIIDNDQLIQDLDAGYIRTQFHPEFPYAILNYTEKAQYDNHWTDATLNCRGLIYNTETDEIVARPFPKFFNYSQLTNPPGPNTPVHIVTDKLDGSMGEIFHGLNEEVGVATRGSFTSDQAVWATQWLNNHPEVYTPWEGKTILTEIIYKSNRIVLNYGEYEGLVLLGAVDNATGHIYSIFDVPKWVWRGDKTTTFPYTTLKEVLDAPNRENAEGLVVLTKDNQLIKFKQDDYIKLHRILTGLTERTIYDLLVSNQSIEKFIEIVPDELHDWVRSTATRLQNDHDYFLMHWNIEYDGIVSQMPENFTQKDFALIAKDSPCRAAMFLRHKNDNERLNELAWKEVQPPATKATPSLPL